MLYQLVCRCLWDVPDKVPGLALVFRDVHVACYSIVVQHGLRHPSQPTLVHTEVLLL